MQPDRVSNLPVEITDISPKWMMAALSNELSGQEISEVRAEPLHLGTASTWRLHLDYAGDAARSPQSVCIKSDFGLPHKAQLAQTGLYRKEARVYLDILANTSARIPACFAAGYDESGRGFMVLEDIALKGGSFCDPTEPLSIEQVAIGVEQLAKMHAATWQMPELCDAEWLHHGVPLSEEDPFWNAIFARYGDLLQHPHAAAMPTVFRDGVLVGRAFNRLRTFDDPVARCLVHGDAHVGNFFVEDSGSPGIADFQCVQRGHVTHDLSSFIGSALDIQDRRASEKDLISHYLEKLSEAGVEPPEFEEIWLGYRRHYLYGLFVWLSTTDRFQSQMALTTNVFRFSMGAIDLDSLGALQ